MSQPTINALIEILKIIMPLLTLIVMFMINHTQNKIHDKQKEIGKQIDGQQTALMDMTEKAGNAEGKLAGKAESRKEQHEDDEAKFNTDH